MRFCKILTTFLVCFFSCQFLFPTTAINKNNGYEIKVVYNQDICPGDPVFLVIQYNFSKNYFNSASSVDINNCISGKAELLDKESKKKIRQGALFSIRSIRHNSCTVLCLVPTSTYLEQKKYDLKVFFSINDRKKNSFVLPIECHSKDFVSEDIPLNARNTNIKQDSSSQRMTQISTLNAILGTADFNGYKNLSSIPSFSEPLVCNRRTSFFGDRRKFIYTDGTNSVGLHYGIDYGVKTGTDVHACANGRVVMAENRVSTGWSICVEHLPGLYSLYYHLDSMNVEVGDFVKEGQLIGKSGCTGLATGPHLHWEIRLSMEAVNPDWFVQELTENLLPEIKTFLR